MFHSFSQVGSAPSRKKARDVPFRRQPTMPTFLKLLGGTFPASAFNEPHSAGTVETVKMREVTT